MRLNEMVQGKFSIECLVEEKYSVNATYVTDAEPKLSDTKN